MQQEDTTKKIKIIKTKEQIKELYPKLFKGIGRFLCEPYYIHTDPSVTPKQTPCRPIPVLLKETFKQEIDKMLNAGVIKPVHKATPWISSNVLVETKDKSTEKPKLHICLDPTNINKAIIHEPCYFCTHEDIAHKLTGATIITVSDCSKGYWHQPLDEESHFMTTFNTEIGRFRFTVMPFKATAAGNVFQIILDTIFLNSDQVVIIIDDMMVIGYQPDESDHDIAFTKFLETTKKNNIKLNYDKIQYKQKEVEFFGETFTAKRCKPSNAKIKAITEMPKPACLEDLQILLGMVQYLSKFSPRIAELAEPLHDLTKKHTPYVWGPEYSLAFNDLKKKIVL